MDFRILGPLEVEARGHTLPLGGPKQRALLGLLLTQANRVISIDHLSYGLWGDSPPDGGAATIQVHVSQLRKLLEPGRSQGTPYQILASKPPGYFLRVEPEQLDLYRFELLRDKASAELASGDAEAAATTFRQALAEWRGPALADFASEPWALGEAERMNEMRIQALEQRIDADLALGRHADLVGELEALVRNYPLRERMCGQLMLALYRSGRQAEASAAFQLIRQLLVDELGMEPGPDLQKLLKQILNQDPQLSVPPPTHRATPPLQGRLPSPLTRFVGREIELDELRRLLLDSRLVSVLGIGGVGKTRLAIEVAGRLAHEYRDGVRYVDLASLTNADLLPQAVLSALGLRDQTSEDVVLVIVNHLASRQILLILDNCEHLAEASARLVETVLMLCQQVRVLATTRETLGVQGESVYRLAGLPPATDSVSLFLDRASATSVAFAATDQQVEAIKQICERLDGIPLAIELAVARLTVMTPQEILRRLDTRLDLLTRGPRTSAERQRTLNATMEWSYRLLTDEEQRLFRHISVCRGWFALQAAEEVGNGSSGPTSDLLARLIDKSMLMPGVGDKAGRCRMLETVREFAARRLVEAEEAEATARRHAEHYIALVERAAPHLSTADMRHWLDLLSDDYDNIRIALEWCLANDPHRGLTTVAALEKFWFRGRQTEGRFWVSRFLHQTEAYRGRTRADALYVEAWLSWMQADYDASKRAADEMIAVASLVGDEYNQARGRRYLAALALTAQEDRALSERLFSEIIPELRELGIKNELAITLNDYSYVLRDLGRPKEAYEVLVEAVTLAQEVGDPWHTSMVTESLASFAMDRGDLEEARLYWHQCLRVDDLVSDQWGGSFVIDGIARLAIQEGRADRALCLLGAANAIRDSMGSVPIPVHQRVIDEVAARSRALLDAPAAEAAWGRGRRMSWAEAVDYALEA